MMQAKEYIDDGEDDESPNGEPKKEVDAGTQMA